MTTRRNVAALKGHRHYRDCVMTKMFPRVALLTALAALSGALPAQAADVGVSVQVSQPGVYGRVDIGRFPQPVLVQSQPVIIVQQAQFRPVQPVYLWVPPGHRKNWRKHCGRYDACGQPVYFVQDSWYEDNVQPRGKGHGKHKDKDKDKGHDKHKD